MNDPPTSPTTEAEAREVLEDLHPRSCVCGRLLREPGSIALGLGPVCRRKLAGRTADVADGQLALAIPGDTCH